jgi:glycosyltransferase involved in cell wall biosynthesis
MTDAERDDAVQTDVRGLADTGEPRLRILRIADVKDERTGGMQRAMYGTGDVLRSQGHTVDYWFRDAIPAPGPEKLRRFTVPIRLPRMVRNLARRGTVYDVLEVHEPLAAVCCLARSKGVTLPPIAVYSHGLEERSYRAMLDYMRRKHMSISLKERFSPLSVVLQAKYAVRHADQVICYGQDYRHLRNAGIPAARLTLMPGAVPSEFLKAEPNWARNPRTIVFIGTWVPRKGIADLVIGASTVLAAEPHARLTVAGCGAPRDRVLAAFPPSLRARVEVIPRLRSNDELIRCYQNHALFVLPSVFEGYGLVVLEAAALGLALVTTDVCGDQFIEDGRTGIQLRAGDPEGLATALLRLIRNPSEARRLGECARRTAQAFTWERAAGVILGAYKGAIRESRTGRRARGTTDV